MKTSIALSYGSQPFDSLEAFIEAVCDSNLSLYASDSLVGFIYDELAAFEESIERTIRILDAAQVPVRDHIRSAFRGGPHKVYRDWRLSRLAHYLISINGNPDNRRVALQQLSSFSIINQKSKS